MPKKVCIFVDGENLRHNIVDLFPYPLFDKKHYIPETDWAALFDWLTVQVSGAEAERVRTYWYAVQNMDFAPEDLVSLCKSEKALTGLARNLPEIHKRIVSATNQKERDAVLDEFADTLHANKNEMQRRFDGWTNVHNKIAQNNNAIEFRKAGAIRCDLLTMELGSEKSVDVKLATDLIMLKDIYDVAVIVSGDQDYVPAVDIVKNFGKKVVNVSFLTRTGRLLPGGAKRLNQSTDSSLAVPYEELGKRLGIKI